MSRNLSPGVLVREIDLSTSVPAGISSAAGTVGVFQWGPANARVLVDSESKLLQIFGKPTASVAQYWYSSAAFLAYSNTLYQVRAISAGFKNAIANSGATAVQIANDDVWEQEYSAGEGAVGPFAARYPGSWGNSLRVSVADAASYTGWEFADLFDSAPGTSDYAEARGGSNDEMHLVVVDVDGRFSGIAGSVLEQYAYVSKGSDAKYNDGGSAYYKTVLSQNSSYIHWMDHLSATNIGTPVTNTAFGNLNDGAPVTPTDEAYDVTLTGGTDDFSNVTDGELQLGWDLFRSAEDIDVAVLFMGPASVATSQYVIDNIAEVRRDLIVTVSPQLADVRGTGIVDKVVAAKNNVTTGVNRSTSYGVFDSNWKMVFDRYNEQNVWVPLNADIAGLCARTDTDRDPWWSPAGYQRGVLKNVIKLAWNPSKTDRDVLYKNGINPVVSFPGQGPLLYGDKTMLTRPSAFDRINVRRLFLVLEKAIAEASKYQLFEFNDAFTRAQFRNMVEPFLRDVQGRRGIYDFKVICDETNNTGEVINRNEFRGDIYISPSRSINFITLSFIATRTGVEFSEVVGST